VVSIEVAGWAVMVQWRLVGTALFDIGGILSRTQFRVMVFSVLTVSLQ